MNRDLTVGKPESVLCKFCLPLFGSIIFQQLYNIADSFVAGKFIGDTLRRNGIATAIFTAAICRTDTVTARENGLVRRINTPTTATGT